MFIKMSDVTLIHFIVNSTIMITRGLIFGTRVDRPHEMELLNNLT